MTAPAFILHIPRDTSWPALARHEAAHAVVVVLLGGEVEWVRLYRDRHRGETRWWGYGPAMAAAVVAMAPDDPSGPDRSHAANLVGSGRVVEAAEHARRLLAGHDDAITAVADELLAEGELAGARVREIVRPGTPPVSPRDAA